MNYRLTIKNINEILNKMYSEKRPLFRFVMSKEQKSYPAIFSDKDPQKRNTRKRGILPVTGLQEFEKELESHFSRNEDARTTMTCSDMLYFFMGGNYRLVTDTTYMSLLVNAKPTSSKFLDPIVEDLVNWKITLGGKSEWTAVDIQKDPVPDGAISVIDYIVKENEYIISNFCSSKSQKELRTLLEAFARNIYETESTDPEWSSEEKIEPFADLISMDEDLVKKLARYLDLLTEMADATEDSGKQPKYLAQGLTWLLLASLLRGKLSSFQGELDKAFRITRTEADTVGIVETASFNEIGKKVFVSSDKELYIKLMTRFHYIRDQHPSIRMMTPDPMLFPNGLLSIKNSERTATEGKDNPISIKDMVEKSWNEHKHLLLIGEGGIGKTVAMLSLPDEEWIRELLIPALYIPLHCLDIYEGNLTSYIKDSYGSDMEKIIDLTGIPWKRHPKVLLLLDGFNEIPMTYRQATERHIRSWMDKPGVQVITTSRISFSLKGRFLEYILEPLSPKIIREFLLSSGFSEEKLPGDSNPLWNVINIPLMLAMFVQIDKVREMATDSNVSFILDWKDSDNAAHIIWNYLQLELYRLISFDDYNSALIAVAILDVTPFVCYEMSKSGKFYLTQEDFKNIIRKAVHFFSQNQDIIHGQVEDIRDCYDGISIEEVLNESYCEFYLNLLSKQAVLFQKEIKQRKKAPDNDRKLEIVYTPAHQNFRDALTAIFISN